METQCRARPGKPLNNIKQPRSGQVLSRRCKEGHCKKEKGGGGLARTRTEEAWKTAGADSAQTFT